MKLQTVPEPVTSIDSKKLADFAKYARGRQNTAETARLRDMWRCLGAHIEACATEVGK